MCTKGKTWQWSKVDLDEFKMDKLKDLYLKIPLCEIAETINVDYRRLRYIVSKLGFPKYKSSFFTKGKKWQWEKGAKGREKKERKVIEPLDRKVMVFAYVKKRHFSIAEKEIKELIKKYR